MAVICSPSAEANRGRKSPLGAANRKTTVTSSIFSTVTGLPPAISHEGTTGESSSFMTTSVYQKSRSSAVKG